MRKLVETTFVTLDGVISDTDPSINPKAQPQVWGSPHWDDQHSGYASKLILDADALLLGRVTYEGFAQAWPPRKGEIADRISALPKHVASKSQPEMKWNATLIRGDVAEEVARLKDQPGQSILKYGAGELDRALMEHNLVDEFHFWIFPVALGAGQRLFDGIDTTHLKLVDTTRFSSGIVVRVYAPK